MPKDRISLVCEVWASLTTRGPSMSSKRIISGSFRSFESRAAIHAVRKLPTWKVPVGEGANRMPLGVLAGIVPSWLFGCRPDLAWAVLFGILNLLKQGLVDLGVALGEEVAIGPLKFWVDRARRRQRDRGRKRAEVFKLDGKARCAIAEVAHEAVYGRAGTGPSEVGDLKRIAAENFDDLGDSHQGLRAIVEEDDVANGISREGLSVFKRFVA